MWAQHLTSAYGAGGSGRAILLTLRYWNYNDVGLATNAITYYEMLLATTEYENWHDCAREGPRTVGQIASYEGMNT